MSELYKRTPNAHCKICGKEIYRRPIEIKRSSKGVFCSSACYGISCRKELPCIVCGRKILAGMNKATCSRTCSNTHRAGIKYGRGHPKDIVVSQRSLKMRLVDLRGRGCERCKYKKVEILQVHHKDRNRSNNSLDNLALICPNCHFEEHYLEKSWLKEKQGGVG